MKLSHSALAPLAVASVAQALVIPSIEEAAELLMEVAEEFSAGQRYAGNFASSDLFETTGRESQNSLSSASDFSTSIFSVESQGLPIVPHRYIIVLKNGISPAEIEFHKQMINAEQATAAGKLMQVDASHDFFVASSNSPLKNSVGGILHSFEVGSLTGYTGYFLDSTIEMLKKSNLVEFIEKDSFVHTNEFETQNGSPWGLARISHRDPLNLGSFNKYLYDGEGGEGVISYIIDTGVLDTHEEFEGRAKLIADIPDDGALDGNGHGTHCSGTIGSKSYGVAKKVHIRGVKVLGANGSGTMSDVVKGVEVAAKDYIAEVKKSGSKLKGASANMSLGGGKSPSLDLAVNAAVKVGLNFAVAAGNENQDACNTSPAAAENAITVGASTISDSRAYFSNWGKCVDIFAPGLNILSTYIGSNSATATLSGTSMASPHIAGLLAYFISFAPSSSSEFNSLEVITPAKLKKNLISYGTNKALSDVGEGSPNILAYNGAGGNLSDFWSLL